MQLPRPSPGQTPVELLANQSNAALRVTFSRASQFNLLTYSTFFPPWFSLV
jgi:hypothetical protein